MFTSILHLYSQNTWLYTTSKDTGYLQEMNSDYYIGFSIALNIDVLACCKAVPFQLFRLDLVHNPSLLHKLLKNRKLLN